MDVTTDCMLPTGAIPQAVVWQKPNGPGDKELHRLGEVRRREGITRHTLALRLGISEAEVRQTGRAQVRHAAERVAPLRNALQVPMAELLQEPDDELSPSVGLRARLLRAMKSVRAIQERARQVSVRRLAGTLADQIAEIMPELRDVGAWPAVGKRRSRKDPGQTYFRRFSCEKLDDLDRFER